MLLVNFALFRFVSFFKFKTYFLVLFVFSSFLSLFCIVCSDFFFLQKYFFVITNLRVREMLLLHVRDT